MLDYLKMYAVRLHLQDQENLQGAGEDQGSGSLPQLTLFVRRENVVRLLEFLGYRQQE